MTIHTGEQMTFYQMGVEDQRDGNERPPSRCNGQQWADYLRGRADGRMSPQLGLGRLAGLGSDAVALLTVEVPQ